VTDAEWIVRRQLSYTGLSTFASASCSNEAMLMVSRRSRRLACVAATSFAMLVPAGASAELGGTAGSIERDRARMQALIAVRQTPRYAVYEMTSESGSTVREFVGTDGAIFAVAWEGPFHPDYQQLLGAYFDRLRPSPDVRRARHAPVLIDTPDFVFQSLGHFRALAGRAYVPRMLPAGVPVEEIR
jgi:hypothetical protein